MDKIEFKAVPAQEWINDNMNNPENYHYCIDIYINNVRLMDTIKEIELPYAKKEFEEKDEDDYENFAGDYGNLLPEEIYGYLAKTFAAQNSETDSKMYLYCCNGCGFSGCWSVLAKVTVTDSTVIWSDFFHNHRDWKYNLFYTFDKQQYFNEVKKIKEFF